MGFAALYPSYAAAGLSCPAKAAHTVRRGFSIQSLTPLEYWITRSSRATTVEGIAPTFAALANDGAKYESAFSRRDPPESCFNLPPSKHRGRRESRVRAAPAVSCAKCAQKHAHEHTGSAESIRPSLRNGFTAYSALSPVTGFVATVAPEKRSLLTNLTPAPGRQDHTTSPSASAALVSRSICVHRIPPRVS